MKTLWALLMTGAMSMSAASPLQYLLSVAASDFHARVQKDSVHFRNVRLGHVITPEGAKQYILCGEFEQTKGGEAGWTPFATIKTSRYEQWIGGQAAGLCQRSSVIWDGNKDISSLLKKRLESLQEK